MQKFLENIILNKLIKRRLSVNLKKFNKRLRKDYRKILQRYEMIEFENTKIYKEYQRLEAYKHNCKKLS